MSIIINVNKRENNCLNNNIRITNENSNCAINNKIIKTNFRMTCNNSTFKFLRSIDLSNIDIVIENESSIEDSQSINIKKNKVSTNGIEKIENIINTEYDERKQDSRSCKDEKNCSLLIKINDSSISADSRKMENKKKTQIKNSTNYNDASHTWVMQTLTYNEKMNRIEAENNNNHMENLNNLSKIMKKKSLPSKFNKNLSSENIFLYKYILSNKELKHSGVRVNKDKKNYENNNNIELNRNLKRKGGLNNDFIYEDFHFCNIFSDESSKTIQFPNKQENKEKILSVSQLINANNIKGLTNCKLAERIKNIKTSLDKYSSTGNVKNYESISSKNLGVELTCFEKLCGNN